MDAKLFAVYLGGKTEGCNIELHDVVFVIGATLEETYPMLAKKWFGNKEQFHIDSYIELRYIDGHEVQLIKNAAEVDSSKKLYFINLGAYKPFEFTEYHQSAFYVTETGPEAVRRAKSELCLGLQTVHKDDVVLIERVDSPLEYDVDDVLEIEKVDDYYISLKPSPSYEKSLPISAYVKLDFAPV